MNPTFHDCPDKLLNQNNEEAGEKEIDICGFKIPLGKMSKRRWWGVHGLGQLAR